MPRVVQREDPTTRRRKWNVSLLRGFVSSWLTLSLIGIGGCQEPKPVRNANRAVDDYFAGDFPRAIQKLDPLSKKTDENYVLNNLRLGSASLVSYDMDDAEAAFLRAWEVINAGGVNSGGRAVAAAWISEKIKIWKGEPYERALASFYLGLVYDMRGDMDNARAAYENALFKLRDYASDKDTKKEDFARQDSTFVLAYIMLGRAWQRLGRDDLAQQQFDESIKLQPQLASLADAGLWRKSNVLLAVDYGYGPKMITTDYGDSVVGFRPTPYEAGPIPLPQLTVDNEPYPIGAANQPTIDTLAMAQDRRWQSIDTIRTVKNLVGTGLMVGGAGYGVYKLGDGNMNGQDAAIAAGLIAAGALLQASSHADTRQWEMVPRSVFLLPLTLPPGQHTITVSFPQTGLQQTWQALPVPERGDAVFYFRMNRFWPGPFVFPAPETHVVGGDFGPPPTTMPMPAAQ